MRTRATAIVAVAVAAVLAFAPAFAQERSPASAEFLVAQYARAACVARCQQSRDRCLNEIPTVTGSQGQRYKPADAVHACGSAYGQCLSECPAR